MKLHFSLQLTSMTVVVLALLTIIVDQPSVVQCQLEAVSAVMSVVPVTSILATAGLVGVKLAAISRVLQMLGYDRAYLASGGAGTAASPIGLQHNYAYMFPYVPGVNMSVKAEHGPYRGGNMPSASTPYVTDRKTYPSMMLPGEFEKFKNFRGIDLSSVLRKAGIVVPEARLKGIKVIPSQAIQQQQQQQQVLIQDKDSFKGSTIPYDQSNNIVPQQQPIIDQQQLQQQPPPAAQLQTSNNSNKDDPLNQRAESSTNHMDPAQLQQPVPPPLRPSSQVANSEQVNQSIQVSSVHSSMAPAIAASFRPVTSFSSDMTPVNHDMLRPGPGLPPGLQPYKEAPPQSMPSSPITVPSHAPPSASESAPSPVPNVSVSENGIDGPMLMPGLHLGTLQKLPDRSAPSDLSSGGGSDPGALSRFHGDLTTDNIMPLTLDLDETSTPNTLRAIGNDFIARPPSVVVNIPHNTQQTSHFNPNVSMMQRIRGHLMRASRARHFHPTIDNYNRRNSYVAMSDSRKLDRPFGVNSNINNNKVYEDSGSFGMPAVNVNRLARRSIGVLPNGSTNTNGVQSIRMKPSEENNNDQHREKRSLSALLTQRNKRSTSDSIQTVEVADIHDTHHQSKRLSKLLESGQYRDRMTGSQLEHDLVAPYASVAPDMQQSHDKAKSMQRMLNVIVFV